MISDSIPRLPTLDEMITAPPDQWRALCALAGADPDYIADLRARKNNPPTKRKSNTRRAGASRASRSRGSAAQAFASQCAAQREALERVNGQEADPILWVTGSGRRYIEPVSPGQPTEALTDAAILVNSAWFLEGLTATTGQGRKIGEAVI